ncbi:CRISPR-associated protein, Csy1 family [Andreprevotia lacus DSM 23236]|uniref:CRISPR-associated protein, Csy1 family n=2 Tax=Andreprevotia TaxID=397275 RepID=A0A1W1X1N4_9NEIS|nr:CRISPR-associated protein, Csy1 family [Andreprevotia lacus DSM 23236]
MTAPLRTEITNYVQARKDAKLDKLQKDREAARKNAGTDLVAIEVLEASFAQASSALQERFEAANWLDDAANRAAQIKLVSHALKYTHSDAKGTSLKAAPQSVADGYLTSAQLADLQLDVVGNAAALDVANLLLLSADGKSLIARLLAEGDATALKPFAKDDAQLQRWVAGFTQALQLDGAASHRLAKQLYFPVGDNEYHLLGPLFATSLYHGLHGRISDARFGDTAKEARKASKQKQHHPAIVQDYPNLAVQTFGGSKPQNLSLLNSQRGGRAYLLCSRPPTWQSRLKPPASGEAFWGQYTDKVRELLAELRSFLVSVQDATSTLAIRDHRKTLVAALIGELHQLAASYQHLAPGWSSNTNLPLEMQCWLDLQRDDPAFLDERARRDWQAKVANRFALWLNNNLHHEKLQMGDVEHGEWSRLLRRELLLLREDLEVLA